MAIQPETTRIMSWNIGDNISETEMVNASDLDQQRSIHNYVSVRAGQGIDTLVLVTNTYSDPGYLKGSAEMAQDWGFADSRYVDLADDNQSSSGIMIASNKEIENTSLFDLGDRQGLAVILGGHYGLQLVGICLNGMDKTAADTEVAELLAQIETDVPTIVYGTFNNERRTQFDQRLINLGKRSVKGAMNSMDGARQKFGLPNVNDVLPRFAVSGFNQAKINVPSMPSLRSRLKKPASDFIAVKDLEPRFSSDADPELSSHPALFVESQISA